MSPKFGIYIALVVSIFVAGATTWSKLESGKRAAKDLKHAEQTRRTTSAALDDRERKKEDEKRRSDAIRQTISRRRDRPLSPLLRDYVDSLH